MLTLTAVADVTDELAFYIENEAQAFSQRDTFAIQKYIDRETFNPDVKHYLASPEVQAVLGHDEAPLPARPR